MYIPQFLISIKLTRNYVSGAWTDRDRLSDILHIEVKKTQQKRDQITMLLCISIKEGEREESEVFPYMLLRKPLLFHTQGVEDYKGSNTGF